MSIREILTVAAWLATSLAVLILAAMYAAATDPSCRW